MQYCIQEANYNMGQTPLGMRTANLISAPPMRWAMIHVILPFCPLDYYVNSPWPVCPSSPGTSGVPERPRTSWQTRYHTRHCPSTHPTSTRPRPSSLPGTGRTSSRSDYRRYTTASRREPLRLPSPRGWKPPPWCLQEQRGKGNENNWSETGNLSMVMSFSLQLWFKVGPKISW